MTMLIMMIDKNDDDPQQTVDGAKQIDQVDTGYQCVCGIKARQRMMVVHPSLFNWQSNVYAM